MSSSLQLFCLTYRIPSMYGIFAYIWLIAMGNVMFVFVCMNVGYIFCVAMIIMFSWLTLSSDPFYMIQYWSVSIWHGSLTQFYWENSEYDLQPDHVEYQRIQNKYAILILQPENSTRKTTPFGHDFMNPSESRQLLSGLRNRAIWIWQRPWRSWRWSNSLGGNISWDVPPLSSSPHQDYHIFSGSGI